MPRIALVTHSNAAVPPELVAQHAITLVPMQLAFLNGSYAEGVDIDLAEFYQRLEEEEVVPATFPPSVPQYMRTFQALAADHDSILVIHISSALTQSLANATAAAREVTGVQIVQHDSGSASAGTGLQVLRAARMIADGADIDAIMAALVQQRAQTLAVFTPATLRYMRNSGRVGAFSALIAMWFGVRPVVEVTEGRLRVVERTRSMEAALDRQIAELLAFMQGAAPAEIAVCHANARPAAVELAARMQALFPQAQIYIADQGPIMSVHTGPGMLGLATYRSA